MKDRGKTEITKEKYSRREAKGHIVVTQVLGNWSGEQLRNSERETIV